MQYIGQEGHHQQQNVHECKPEAETNEVSLSERLVAACDLTTRKHLSFGACRRLTRHANRPLLKSHQIDSKASEIFNATIATHSDQNGPSGATCATTAPAEDAERPEAEHPQGRDGRRTDREIGTSLVVETNNCRREVNHSYERIYVAEQTKVKIGQIHDQKIRAEKYLAELLNRGDKRKHDRLQECCTWLEFEEYEKGDARLVRANSCMMNRLCVWCAVRRSIKLRLEYTNKLIEILIDNPDLVPCMVTLTIPTGPDVKHQFQKLSQSMRKAYKRGNGTKRGRMESEFAKVLGAIWAIEITKRPNGHFHVHTHGLVLRHRKEYFNQRKLSDEWHQITGDARMVDVRLLHCVHKVLKEGKSYQDIKQELYHDLEEVFKYVLKLHETKKDIERYERSGVKPPVPLSPEDVCKIDAELKGRRFLRAWGPMFKVEEPEDLAELPLSKAPLRELAFAWNKYSKAYELCKTTSSTRERILK